MPLPCCGLVHGRKLSYYQHHKKRSDRVQVSVLNFTLQIMDYYKNQSFARKHGDCTPF